MEDCTKNFNVYLNKLKLNPKYIDEPHIALMLNKPGTLSKKEKEWLRSYVALLELRDIKSDIRRDKLSDDFVKSLRGNK